MKHLTKYIIGAMALVAAAGMTSCQDHFDEPSIDAPVATMTPNTTIAELKELAWSDKDNYCVEVYTKEWYATPAENRTEEMKTEGTHIVVSGRVVSSDYAGNCFKYIVLQDETGALNFSINSYNLYLQYRRGQEVVVDVTGLYMGKYRGLEQVGFPSYNSSLIDPADPDNHPYETSFMAPEFFARNAQLNGWPDRAAIDTVEVNKFSELGVSPAELRKWQSQLVRFNNVEFVKSSLETLSTYHSSGETQQIRDAEGNTLDIRTSGYANFWNMKVPEQPCDIVAILGYYVNLAGSGGWQLTLLDAASIMNVGDPTVPQGTEGNPWSVMQAIALQVNDQDKAGWVKGYIVGTVAPGVETVSSNNDIEWSAEATLANTLVIGATPETKDIAQCLVITLPQGSDLRAAAALRENPGNYGKEIALKGTFAEVMGTYGITGNNGTSSEFILEGVTPPGPVEGDGTETSPYSVSQVLAKGTNANEPGVWVTGYIVGSCVDKAYSSATFTADGASNTNLLMADTPDCTEASKCIPVAIAISLRDGLSLAKNPGNLGKKLEIKGDIIKYFGVIGLKETTEYKLEGGDTPTPPSTDPVSFIDENFASSIPSTWSQVQIAGNKTWFQRSFQETTYASMTGYNGTAPFDQWLVSPAIDMSKVSNKTLTFRTQVNGYGSTTSRFEVYVMTAADTKGTNTKLNPTLATAPSSGYSSWENSGNLNLSAYNGIIYLGFRYYATEDANYATWCVTDIKLGVNGGGDTPNPPTPPVGDESTAVFNFAEPTSLTANPALGAEEPDGTTGNTKINVNGTVFTSNGVTVTDTGTGTEARLYHQVNGDWSYRVYNKSTMTITAPAGAHLVSVNFDTQTATHATNLGKCTFDTGTYTDKIWTASGTSTTTLTVTVNATVGMTGLTVKFDK